jgi:cell wall-associated NlpC family hydrolase
MNAWQQAANQLVGRPWHPRRWSCYDCVRWLYREVRGLDLPRLPVALDVRARQQQIRCQLAAGDWRERVRPQPGSVALLTRLAQSAHHVGVALAPDLLLHCCEQTMGTVVISGVQLRFLGWQVLNWYEWSEHV